MREARAEYFQIRNFVSNTFQMFLTFQIRRVLGTFAACLNLAVCDTILFGFQLEANVSCVEQVREQNW
jgi:uncharacterized membrane protein